MRSLWIKIIIVILIIIGGLFLYNSQEKIDKILDDSDNAPNLDDVSKSAMPNLQTSEDVFNEIDIVIENLE